MFCSSKKAADQYACDLQRHMAHFVHSGKLNRLHQDMVDLENEQGKIKNFHVNCLQSGIAVHHGEHQISAK